MARAKGGTTKRQTAAERATKKQIDGLQKKLGVELEAHNQLTQECRGLDQMLAERKLDLQTRLGRLQMLAEQLKELGVTGEMVELPLPDADEKEE